MSVLLFLASTTTDQTLQQSSNTLKKIANSAFGGHSLIVLTLSLIAASIVGRITTSILRRLSHGFGKQADAATNLDAVNQFRRLETWTILSIAIARVVLFVFALYFWWSYTHPGGQPSALIGASALLAVIIGGVFSPLLRDFAFGGGMMAEHWFGVGDLITIEPFSIRGVVERITLRSTRIRGLNGEVIWVANQNISSVRVAQKGVWTMAVELFVSDRKRAEQLITRVNALMPTGPALLVSPLNVMTVTRRGEDVWHMTAIGETAPGREWLIERTAIDLLMKLDERSKNPVLITNPVSRYADNETERQFARAVKNAKKTKRKPRLVKRTGAPTPPPLQPPSAM